jgi:hypothetical protein
MDRDASAGGAAAAKSTRWGLSAQDWESARAQAEALLVERARQRRTVTYSELCASITVARFTPYSWRLIALLDEICSERDAERGIVLATLVVRRDSGRPGEGYFAHAARAGRDVADREGFWLAEAERAWSSYDTD